MKRWSFFVGWPARLAALLLVPLLAACASAGFFGDDLSSAEERWAKGGLINYRYTLQIGCFCPPPLNDQLLVEVRNGATVRVSAVSSGEDVSLAMVDRVATIPGLFATIRDANERKADKIDVSYNAALGYPERISIDYIVQAVDDEVGYIVTDLAELPEAPTPTPQ
jgi:hypothetical protein